MATFVSPTGNLEVWEDMPEGYSTVEAWLINNPPAPSTTTQEEQAANIRAERDRRLSSSDISQLTDVQHKMTSQEALAWINYRQALRDIPQQVGFPWGGIITDAPWPTLPSTL